jgi:hypothetical protein
MPPPVAKDCPSRTLGFVMAKLEVFPVPEPRKASKFPEALPETGRTEITPVDFKEVQIV